MRGVKRARGGDDPPFRVQGYVSTETRITQSEERRGGVGNAIRGWVWRRAELSMASGLTTPPCGGVMYGLILPSSFHGLPPEAIRRTTLEVSLECAPRWGAGITHRILTSCQNAAFKEARVLPARNFRATFDRMSKVDFSLFAPARAHTMGSALSTSAV